MWSVDPDIDEFAQRADHEGSFHIGSGPLGDDGAPKNLVPDHLHAGSHQFHGCWSVMIPGLVAVGNMASVPVDGLVAGPVGRADTRRWQGTALEGVQAGEEGMSSQCSYTGLDHDLGSEQTEIDGLEGFGLVVGGRSKHSRGCTR